MGITLSKMMAAPPPGAPVQQPPPGMPMPGPGAPPPPLPPQLGGDLALGAAGDAAAGPSAAVGGATGADSSGSGSGFWSWLTGGEAQVHGSGHGGAAWLDEPRPEEPPATARHPTALPPLRPLPPLPPLAPAEAGDPEQQRAPHVQRRGLHAAAHARKLQEPLSRHGRQQAACTYRCM
jgi:hypothetical protein